jgi:hypothetical protein
MYKPSSLLGLVVSDEGKKFYNIDHRCQRNKTYFRRRRGSRLSQPGIEIGLEQAHCFGSFFPHLNVQKTCLLWAPTTPKTHH